MNLIWKNTVAEIIAKGANQPNCNVFEQYSGPYPLVHDTVNSDGTAGARAEVELVAARTYKVNVGTDVYSTVIVCRMVPALVAGDPDIPNWSYYCGDEQIQGTHRADGKNLAHKLRTEKVVDSKVIEALDASSWVNTVPDQTNCNFFKMQARGRNCSHCEATLKFVDEPTLQNMAVELAEWKAGKASSLTVPEAAQSPEEATFYNAAFIQPVLLVGERGSGKTYLARLAAEKYNARYLEMQMHPSMEAWEFRAHDRAFNGQIYTVLGKLAEAVHWIQKGERVVLCLDEFLNMNPVFTTAINTALTLTKNDTYLIDTGKIIDAGGGIGVSETVEVPADMLWIVATSNVGARYNLDKMIPSVRARFLIVLMNTNADRTKHILEKSLSKYEMPLALADMFKTFIEAVNEAVAQNTLDEEATTRMASNVIRAVATRAKLNGKRHTTKSWISAVKEQVMAEIAQVVNFELGPLDEDQKSTYKSLVDASFK